MSENVITNEVVSEKKKKEIKKWKDMTNAEKLAQMPEYKTSVEKDIENYKKKLSDAKRLLKDLENEEKAIKFEMIQEKALAEGKSIEDLM